MNTSNLPNFYSHTVTFEQNNRLNLLQLGRDLNMPGFSYPQYHNSYILYYINSGAGTLEIDGKKYILKENDAFLISPNKLAVQTADTQNPWELYFFSFNGSLAEEILNRTVFKSGTVTVSLKPNNLPETILNATQFLNNNFHSELSTLEYFFKFISYFDIYKTSPEQVKNFHEQKYVSEIKKYIQSNYLQTIKINDIADKLNINRSHLYRVFKKETGIGIEEYIINIRISHAKKLLSETFLPVSTIASLVGYKNYNTFFKIFKSNTGLTPVNYRKKANNAQ